MSATKKERLDVILVKKKLIESREKAKAAILAGLVFVDGKKIDKPGFFVRPDEEIVVKSSPVPYVSRGGLKLEKALKVFDVPVKDRVFVDVGASTGGFTHCLLNHGARKVYAIDVGYGQLAWNLRQDNRVVVMERTNIRHVDPKAFTEKIEGAVIDVSFISLKLVLPVVKSIVAEKSDIIALVKPQFEAGRDKVGRKGVVRDPAVHKEVLMNFFQLCQELGLILKGVTHSPITGPEGNIEFLTHIYKSSRPEPPCITGQNLDYVVELAHVELLHDK
jgi:23S rRNA (cytidine1920-2'-O)/16S rRNA (cytidine1409-2'-O)-methyltransferase